MQPHRMRLKGPWEYEWIEGSGADGGSEAGAEAGASTETSGRVKMPADWQSLFGLRGGRIRFRRRFQCPTNLEPHEQVFIVLDGVGGRARVGVNDEPLGTLENTHSPQGFEITHLLQPSNLLQVEVRFDPRESGDQPGGLWAPVALEIRAEESDRE